MKKTQNSPVLLANAKFESRGKHDTGNNIPGEICLANDARFIEGNFSEPLTAYAAGWRDEGNLESELDFIAPPVQVSRRFEFAAQTNAEFFYSEADDIRAIGSPFNRVTYTQSKTLGKTLNKGLTMRVDLDQVAGMPNWRENYTARLLKRLLRNELRRIYVAALAAGTDTPKTWDTSAGKDPDQDVRTAVIASGDDSGMSPNRIVYDITAWNKRAIAHRAQTGAGGFASSGMTIDQVAGYLNLRKGLVSESRYVADGAASATDKSRTFGSGRIIIFMADPEANTEDPSNFKRFWTPCEGGEKFRVYEQQVSAKFVDITVEHYSQMVVTSTLGIQTFTIS